LVVFAIRIERALDVAVQSAHDANPGEHHRAAKIGHKHQRLDRGLPFSGLMFGLW
jgi:hypothetical protein